MVHYFKVNRPLVMGALAPGGAGHVARVALGPARRYGLAVGSVCAAAALASALWSSLPYLSGALFLGAIVLSAWAGGRGPGLVATLLSTIGLDLLVLRLPPTIGSGTQHALGLGVFCLVGILIAVLCAVRSAGDTTIPSSTLLLDATLDALGVPMAILDRDGVIVAENAVWRRAFLPDGVTGVGTRGARYIDVWPADGGDERAAVALGMGDVFGGTCQEFVGEFARWSGEEHRWFAVRVTRFDRAGGPRALVIHEDITERKRVEEAERDEQTLRSVARLASAVAHEINNPLAIIMGNIEIIAQQVNPAASDRIRPTLDAIERIRVIVQRMTRITNLEFSRQSPRLPEMLDLRRSSTAPPPSGGSEAMRDTPARS